MAPTHVASARGALHRASPILYISFQQGRPCRFTDLAGRPANHRRDPMAWVYLVIAGLFEIGWAIGLKYTEGFTRIVPTTLTVGAMVISVVLLGVALRELPVGTGYAVWTGIGTVGTAVLGMLL